MASKLTLIDISSGFKGTDVNTNFTSIEDEFDDTLSRSGKSPNTMNAELDMNSNKIRNLAQAANNSDAATLKDVIDQTTEDATSKPATAITVSDSAGHFSSDNVEGALEELPVSITARVELGGNFDAGIEVVVEKIGSTVTITVDGTLSHNALDSVTSQFGVLPEQFRPTENVNNVFYFYTGGLQRVQVTDNGTISTKYRDYAGADKSETIAAGFTISYVVASEIT